MGESAGKGIKRVWPSTSVVPVGLLSSGGATPGPCLGAIGPQAGLSLQWVAPTIFRRRAFRIAQCTPFHRETK